MIEDPLPLSAGAELLTKALRESGALSHGGVRSAQLVSSVKKLRSHTLRLRLDYDRPAGDAPDTIILKVGYLDIEGRSRYANRQETAFYREVAPRATTTVVPRCFEVVEATETSTWHLLLEDLTDSHYVATEWPLPPSQQQYEAIAPAQARFHAEWWDSPLLGISVGCFIDDWDGIVRILTEQFARFIDRYGELLPAERRGLYEQLFDRAPHLLARQQSRRNLTLIHGDAHPWNFFLPQPGIGAGVRLIDWESWTIDTATDDLAYMMAMLLYPDRRHRMERPLLDLYHEALLIHGVNDYDRQALQDDYRLSVLWLITRPIGQAANNIPARIWWNNLERIMLAVDDLGCRDLIS